MVRRLEKINDAIRDEIGSIFLHILNDPRVSSLTTVTNVYTTRDFSRSIVTVSVLDEEEKQMDTVKALNRATNFIRRQLGMRIKVRKIPELVFKLDTSMSESQRILDILNLNNIDDNLIENS
jgi:ribosome-binding factor A